MEAAIVVLPFFYFDSLSLQAFRLHGRQSFTESLDDCLLGLPFKGLLVFTRFLTRNRSKEARIFRGCGHLEVQDSGAVTGRAAETV